MSELMLYRYSSTAESTLGVLTLDGALLCYTLEDAQRPEKIAGKTCIPQGTYALQLRNYGGFYQRYTERWDWHKGMVEVVGVPQFSDILIHCGNAVKDTRGCILVGNRVNNNTVDDGFISNSRTAYAHLYPTLQRCLENNNKMNLTIQKLI